MSTISHSLIRLPKHKHTKAQKQLQRTFVPLCPRGEFLVCKTEDPDRKTVLAPSTMACPAQGTSHCGQPAADCADHEAGLLDLADALLRNAPQEYLQQAFAPTLAHVNHCMTCQATLIDLVLTTLHYEADLPTSAAADPAEVAR